MKITLNLREINRIHELFDRLHDTGDYGVVTLEQTNESGIGSVLTATFSITHRDVDGEFSVTISDESNW